jgi:UrcA family protein
MNRSLTKRSGVAVALLAAAALIPALATTDATALQSATRTVRFADLDLSRPKDTKILLERIRGAAHDVCTVNGFVAQQTCYHKAVRDAVQKTNRPELTAAL